MTVPFVVLADDSSGANASAGALAVSLGRDVPVFDALPSTWTFPMVLNTRSREDASRRDLVETWARVLWDAGVRNFDKRIDTVLRGPGPEELLRLCAALPETPWIGVAAAYPRAGRATRDGRQYLEGHPVRELVELDTDHLGEYLFGAEKAVRIVAAKELGVPDLAGSLANVPQPVIFDADGDADLIQIAQVLRQVRRQRRGVMVTVTSGALLNYYPADSVSRTVIVMGSPTAVNVSQVKFLGERHPAILWPLQEPFPSGQKPEQDLIVLHSGLRTVAPQKRLDLSSQLAAAALQRLEELANTGWVPERIILTGGELSQAFLSQSGAHGARMSQLAAPLVGHGRIDGGNYAGSELLTKGGMVGHPALLLELALSPALRHE